MKKFIAAITCALVVGCASVGGKNSTDANVIQGLNAALDVAKTLYVAGSLTDAEAQATEDALNAIFGFIKASRTAAAAGDAAGESRYLRSAADALDALTTRLLAKKGK